MAKQGLVVVTGLKELDDKLRGMPNALQKKFIRGALRKCGKRLTQEVVGILKAEAYDTGTLARSIKVKSNKRSRKQVGVSIMPPRGVLFANYAKAQQKQRKKAGNATFDRPKADYYPAFVEFGTPTQPAKKPFRRALYDNANLWRRLFRADVLEFIEQQKISYKL